jgi:hypothetical protein
MVKWSDQNNRQSVQTGKVHWKRHFNGNFLLELLDVLHFNRKLKANILLLSSKIHRRPNKADIEPEIESK